MSLATSIKEFSDILNQISTVNELNGTFSYLTFLQEFFLFSIKNLVSATLYLLSLSWLKDFSYLPLLAPQLNPSSYFEQSYFEDPLSHIISVSRLPTLLEHDSNLKTSGYATEQLLRGFVNSFFFSLPFSLPHLISMKRFLSQGVSAGVSSVLGTIAAHSLFLIGVLYGLRFLIIPWFSYEPLNYIVGILIVVAIVNELVQEKKVYIVPRSKQNGANLLKIGTLNFLLTWCEESTVFHSFNHLTLNAHNTYLDLYPAGTAPAAGLLHSFFIHTTYLVAFILGNCIFSCLFYFLFLQSTQYLAQWTGFALAKVARTLNKVVLFLIVAFTLSSFPYYGLDYLLGKVGGFLPEDPAYMETVLSPTVIRKIDRDFSDQTSKNGNKKKIVPLDVNYFDQGVYLYLETPLEDDPKEDFIANQNSRAHGFKEEVAPITSMESKNSFEELNYRGEYAWTFHNRYKKTGSKEKTGFLSGIAGGQAFKKPKNHYMELKLQSDKRQAEAASRAADKIPLGRLSEWKEGVLPRTGSTVPVADTLLPITGHEAEQAPRSTSLSEHSSDLGPSGPSTASIKAKFGLTTQTRAELSPTEGRWLPLHPIGEYVTELTESISPFEDDESEKLLPIENLIKTRYVFNPVYRTLLKTDIDAFLARQPKKHNLAANQEYNLAKKRQLLEKYYNWLRYYSPFEKDLEQLYEIPQTKSFVDSVYHQQFKGTLQIARRLFSVTFDQSQTPAQSLSRAKLGSLLRSKSALSEAEQPSESSRPELEFAASGQIGGTELPLKADQRSVSPTGSETKKQRRVLSYDQTLYTESDADVVDGALLLHEQLLSDKNVSSQTRAALDLGQGKTQVNNKSLSSRATAEHTFGNPRSGLKSITTFEDLESGRPRKGESEVRIGKQKKGAANNVDVKLKNKESLKETIPSSLLRSNRISRSPFIEESNSSPIYAGWDETLRQFVVTNKFALNPLLARTRGTLELP
nr:hypothetical chloroplast RF1 [Chloroidium sp. KL-2023a]